MRERINLEDDIMSVILKMSEGNPGALSVITEIIKVGGDTGFMEILNLDDMNIRGGQIWFGYNDFAGGDLDIFRAAIMERSQAMVDRINESNNREERDVTSGASYNR